MAQDIFAPKSSFDIGYERPVARPVADDRGKTQAEFEAMANDAQAAQIRSQTQVDKAGFAIGSTILEGLTGFAGRGIETAQKKQASGLANNWLSNMQDAQGLRDQGKFTEAALMERKATKAAVSGGLDLDKYKTEYEAITGSQMEYLGQTQEQQSFELMKKDKNFQNAYFAAKGKLGPRASEDQLVATALTSIQKQAIAADTLALVGAGNQLDWENQTKGAYLTILDTFDDSVVADLVARTAQGSPITPGEISSVLMQHNLMSQKIIKPAYVSDEQWGVVQDRLTLQKEFLTSLRDARDPDNLIADVVSQMMQNAEKPEDVMAIGAAADPATFAATMGTNIPETLNKVAKTAFTDNNFKNKGAILKPLQEVDVTTPVNGNTTFTFDESPAFFDKYKNVDPAQKVKNVKAGRVFLDGVTPNSVQTEAGRKQFYNATMSVAAGMMSDKQFYSSAEISGVFNNRNIVETIKMLDSIDKDSADEIRVTLRSVSNMQKKALQANLNSIEAGLGVGSETMNPVWDEEDKKYYVTGETGIKILSGLMGERYVTDKGFYLDPKANGAPIGIADAYDRRKSIAILDRAVQDLALEGVETDTNTATQAPAVPQGVSYQLPQEVLGDTEFLNEVTRVSTDLNVSPNDLLAVIDFETMGSFSPSQKSGTSSATGLIQFLKSTAEGLGTSTEALSSMTRAEQMKYVEKYLKPYKGRIKNQGDLYMAVHWPRAVGKSDDYVMYREGSDNYKSNKSLDVNKDGTVTRAESLQRLRSVTGRKLAITQTELEPAGATPVNEIVDNADAAISNAESLAPTESLRPMASPIGNVNPRPGDAKLAAAWDLLYGATHDPETGQIIQGG